MSMEKTTYVILGYDLTNHKTEKYDEWNWIVNNLFMPKCEVLGYCPEKKSCGRKPKKENK